MCARCPGTRSSPARPTRAHSIAADFVSPTTPCLLATYAGSPAKPTSPAPDATLTIAPDPAGTITASSARIEKNTPSRFTAIVARHASSG